MKAKDLRQLSIEELVSKERKLRDDLLRLNQQRYSGKVDKPHMFKLLRKDIARILTVIKEKIKNKE
ncbi:MAG: 50S ribosomal protein L29 [Candidatus Omnitrophica bacterium]|nr:50S ribosomal protein L29 [Candidatus Omnitrophota bacterium]